MKTIRVNFLKDNNGKPLTVIIYYNEGRTFSKEALYRFLKGMGYNSVDKKYHYGTGYGIVEEYYAPGHLDEYEICVVEFNSNTLNMRFCPDYFLLDEEVE